MKIETVEINGTPYVPLLHLTTMCAEAERLRRALKDIRKEVLGTDPDGSDIARLIATDVERLAGLPVIPQPPTT